uniref:Eukaryotic translation initiation factor 3 subunit J n=1 Tax=Rhizophora mucronata TaxID=61149 RepID=A0A2P2KVI7_RHIMU
MEDWEEDGIPSLLSKEQPKSKWDDEDVEESDVKESWEDEDQSDPEPVAKPPEKVTKKPVTKSTEKKGKTVEAAKEEPLDPVAEKLRHQRYNRTIHLC